MGLPLVIKTRDEIMCNIQGLTIADKNLLYKKFGIFIPNARFMPKYKLGIWDGKIHYFDMNGNIPIGLLPEAFSMIDLSQYDVSLIPYQGYTPPPKFELIDESIFSDFDWEPGHRLSGEPIMLEEHQVRGVNALLSTCKGLIEYGTGAGKTIMTAAICRQVCPFGKVVIIVPSRDLVKNTSDQLRYLKFNCGTVNSESEREEEYTKDVVVITWQSILSMCRRVKGQGYWKERILEAEKECNKLLAKKMFAELKTKQALIREFENNLRADKEKAKKELDALKDGVIGFIFDEVHCSKANEVKTILSEIFPAVQIRYGMTGTVPKDLGDKYCVFAGIGPVVGKMSAHDLQERGFLADSEIRIVQLAETIKFVDYQSEVEYVSTDETRLKFVARYAMQTAEKLGNTLLLVSRVSTGEALEEFINDMGGDCVFLSGRDSTKIRDTNYKRVNSEDHALIIATAQIASTGINMPRLMNLIFLDSGKSFVRTIQSIGRGLRLGKGKTKVLIHDISSALKWQKAHLNQRKKYYEEAKIPATMVNLTNWKDSNASFI